MTDQPVQPNNSPKNFDVPPGASAAAAADSNNLISESRRRELADFLRTRREKLKPEDMGLSQSSRRRTPGLRREEVAELAGVGTTWYTWLEQARDIQPSAEVLRRLGQALKLSLAELRHMFSLAGKAPPNDLDASDDQIPESLMRVFNDAIVAPAVLLGGRWDILALNAKAKEIFPEVGQLRADRRNWLYYVFCVGASKKNVEGWEGNARRVLAEFRASLSDSLDHPWVVELVTLLREESKEFESWWKEHDVREHSAVRLNVSHPSKGLQQYERTVLRPSENSRLKILIFSPILV